MHPELRPRRAARRLRAAFLALLGAACATGQDSQYDDLSRAWRRAQPPGEVSSPNPEPFSGASVLERSALVRAVLERNPTLGSMHAAWRASLERYPQAVSFADPSLTWALAPRTFGAHDFVPTQRIELAQPLPFFGKRALRGAAALAEAEAAQHDFAGTRVRLAALASSLLDDYALAARGLEINREHVELLRAFQRSALARYEAGFGSQQDPLQAETELARLAERDLELANDLAIARARINALLHRPPDAPLPQPPAQPDLPHVPDLAPGGEALQASALEARPELAAASARVRAREAEVASARREFLPDLTVMGGYDRFWEEPELRTSLGVEIELPLRLRKRRAALDEARARLDAARKEAAGLADEVRFDAQRASEELERARKLRALFEDVLLPTARERVAAARAGFETGRNTFLELIEAEHELRDVRFDAERARADENRRSVELLAALGRVPTGTGDQP
jgi:outer membrane protein TolC